MLIDLCTLDDRGIAGRVVRLQVDAALGNVESVFPIWRPEPFCLVQTPEYRLVRHGSPLSAINRPRDE